MKIIVVLIATLANVVTADSFKLKTVLGDDKYSYLIDRSVDKRPSQENKSMW